MRLLDTLNPRMQGTTQPAQLEEQPVSVWEKGLRRGLGGLGTSAKAFFAQQVEPFAPEWSRRQIAEANTDMQGIIQSTPMVDRIENIKNVGDFGEWLVGTTAQAVPSIGTALGGAALGRLGLRRMMSPNAASYVGAGAATVPLEGGETAMQLHADPVAMANTTPSQRALFSLGRGVGGAAQESIIPAMTVNKFMRATPLTKAGLRPALSHIGKTGVIGGTGEALTEGGQYVTGQFAHKLANPDVELVDKMDLANAMAAGFAPGTALGTMGGTADAIHGNLNAVGRQVKRGYDFAKGMTAEDAGKLARDATDGAQAYFTKAVNYIKDKTGVTPRWPGSMSHEDIINAAYATGELTRKSGESVRDAYNRFMEGFGRNAVEADAAGEAKPFVQRVVEWEDKAIRALEDAKTLGQAVGTAAKRGYEGAPLVDPYFEKTGKSLDQVTEQVLSNANIDTTNEETFQASSEKQWSETVQEIADMLAGDVDIISNSKFADELNNLLYDPDIARDPAKQRRVVKIAQEFRDSREQLKALLDTLPPQAGSASRQMTEDEVIFDNVMQDSGIRDKQLREKLRKLSKHEVAFANELIKLKAEGIIDENAQNNLLFNRPVKVDEPVVVRIPKKKKLKGNFAQALDEVVYNEDFLGLRVRQYVDEAVKGTNFDSEGDKTVIEGAVVGMLEALSRDEMTRSQAQAVRTRLESALGDAGTVLFDSLMEAAHSYTGDSKFRAVRERPEHLSAVEALRNMRSDSTPAGAKHEHTRSVLNRLVTTLIDADTAAAEPSVNSKQRQETMLESLRSRGRFKEAVELENYFSTLERDTPYKAYHAMLQKYFGKKSKSADIVVRKYAKDIGFEITHNEVSGSTNTGKLMEDENDMDTIIESMEVNPDLEEKVKSEMNEKRGRPDEIDQGFGNETRYFGQTGKNLGKYDQFPGAPLTSAPTYDYPSGEASGVMEAIDAKWTGLRTKPISVLEWAKAQKGDPEDVLRMAAEATIRNDAVQLKKLQKLRNEGGTKIHKGQMLDATQVETLLANQIAAIYNRARLWEASKSGTAFFNNPSNSGLRYIESALAKGTMLERNKRDTDKFEIPANEADKTKWVAKKLGTHNATTLSNSLMKVRAKDGRTFYHDIGGDVAEMMRRNQTGDISGVFEKEFEPTLRDLVRGAFASTVTSLMMSGDYSQNMLVDEFNDKLVIYRDDVSGRSMTYGEAFGSQGDKTADFSKAELTQILPDKAGPDLIREATTSAGIAAGEQAQRYIANKALVKDGKEIHFNPRAMIKAMGQRYGLDMDTYLPIGSSSEGLSAMMVDKFMKEGLDILAAMGYEPASSHFDRLTSVLWDVEYADGKVFPVMAGSSFYRKNLIELGQIANAMNGKPIGPSWGEYSGTHDMRSDRIVAQSEKVENLTNRLAKAVKAVEEVVPSKNEDVSHKLGVLKDDVAEVREQLTRATDKLFEMMGWATWESKDTENKFNPIDTENIRMQGVYKEASVPLKEGVEQEDGVSTQDPALFDIGALYRGLKADFSDFRPVDGDTELPAFAKKYVNLEETPRKPYSQLAEVLAKNADEIQQEIKIAYALRGAYRKALTNKLKAGEPTAHLQQGIKDLGKRIAELNSSLALAKGKAASTTALQKAAKRGNYVEKLANSVNERPAMPSVYARILSSDEAKKLWSGERKITLMGPQPAKSTTMTVEPKVTKLQTTARPSAAERAKAAEVGRAARLADIDAYLAKRAAREKPASGKVVSEVVPFDKIVEITQELSTDFPLLKASNVDEHPEAKAYLEKLMALNLPSRTELIALAADKYGSGARPGALVALSSLMARRDRGSSASMEATGEKKSQSADEVKADIQRRLGDTVDFFMRDVLRDKASGWHTPPGPDRVKAMLEVAMTATNWRGTAAHESWHEVERLLKDMGEEGQYVLDSVHNAMASEAVHSMLKENFKDDPGVLAQIEPGERHNYLAERASFAFQLYVQNDGKIPLPPKTRGLFKMALDMFKRLMGITDDLVKTGNFFKYFDTGEFAKDMKNPKSVLNGLAETRREKYAQQLGRAMKPLRKLAFAAFGHAADRIIEMNIPAYTDILKRMHQGEGANVGYMHEHRVRRQAFFNEYTTIVEGFNGKLPPAQMEKLSALIKRVEDYKAEAAKNSKTKVEFDRARRTLPPVFDLTKIQGRLDEFRKDLKAYGGLQDTTPAGIEELIGEIILNGYYSNTTLFKDYPEKAQKYTSEDMDRQAFSYINRSTHEAEMARAFSDKTLDQLLEAGDKEATPYQRSLIRTFTNAAQGRAGMDMNPQLRKLFGTVITGINLSLLPFAVFSQMVEPFQLAFRKNDLKSSVDSAFRGFKGLPRMFKAVDSVAQKDFFEKVASELGLVVDASTVSMMADLMNEVPITGTLEKINKAFFRYNGMEFWHRTMYAAATKNAFGFIKEHDKEPTKNSDALLAEIGLKRGEIKYTKDGEVDHHDPKIRAAIIRFATQSMAQPDAATNAMWMNDPRLSLIAHLKRFTFGFSYYVNSRAVQNIKDKNFKALAPLAFAVPWMIAMDGIRDMVRPGEETWKNNWGVTNYVANGIERTGLLGRYGLGVDALKTIDFGGSAVEAISPAAQITGKVARGVSEGHGWEALFNTLPGHQLYGT